MSAAQKQKSKRMAGNGMQRIDIGCGAGAINCCLRCINPAFIDLGDTKQRDRGTPKANVYSSRRFLHCFDMAQGLRKFATRTLALISSHKAVLRFLANVCFKEKV